VGYTAVMEGEAHALVAEVHTPEIAAALFRREGCVPLGAEGRGQVFRFPCGEGHGVLRPYRRGGLPGRVLRDSFLFVNRPLREFRVHAALHAGGVPCPAPLGVMWSQHGAAFRGAIATAWVDGVSLQGLLQAGDASLPETLEAAGKAIRALHDAGGLHADLHPANVLVARGQAFLIDFDRARLLAALTPRQRASNLLRLRRAFVKHGFGLHHFDALLAGYGEMPGAGRLQGLLAAAHEAAVKRAGHR
jgi:3-deoxy-D-manno-octulosonic acid kinase